MSPEVTEGGSFSAEIASSFSILPLLGVLFASIGSSNKEIASANALGFDFAAAAWLLLALVHVLTDKVNIAEFIGIWGLIAWLAGVTNLLQSILLDAEIALLFGALGLASNRRGVLAAGIILSPLWIGGSIISREVLICILAIEMLATLQKQSPKAEVAAVLALCLGSMVLKTTTGQSLFSFAGTGIAIWRLQANSHAVSDMIVTGIALAPGVLDRPAANATIILVVFLVLAIGKWMKRNEPFWMLDEEPIVFLVGLMIIREGLVPSPGITRLGSLHSSTSVFLLALIFVACAKGLTKWLQITRLLSMSDFSLVLLLANLVWYSTLTRRLGFDDQGSASLPVVVHLIIAIGTATAMARISPIDRRPQSVFNVVLVSAVWLMWALLSSRVFRPLPFPQWYGYTESELRIYCASRAIEVGSTWVTDTPVSRFMPLDALNAYRSKEPTACRTSFPTQISKWTSKKTLVLGDSVGRFVFYAMTNALVNPTYGFPKGAFHGNISVSDTLHFKWAPMVSELSVPSEDYDIIILSCGLWDKLWKRDPQLFGDHLERFFVSFKDRKVTKPPLLILVEMTPTISINLFGAEKQQYLTEETAPEWRRQASAALESYPGPKAVLPTMDVTKDRVARDGVHYSDYVYRAMVSILLRGIPLSDD